MPRQYVRAAAFSHVAPTNLEPWAGGAKIAANLSASDLCFVAWLMYGLAAQGREKWVGRNFLFLFPPPEEESPLVMGKGKSRPLLESKQPMQQREVPMISRGISYSFFRDPHVLFCFVFFFLSLSFASVPAR